ncbi:hypothetical protein NFI96_026154, partial [Prochilodus magdalenae]
IGFETFRCGVLRILSNDDTPARARVKAIRAHVRTCFGSGDSMDNRFPAQLFPHFFINGPPDLQPTLDSEGWGSYEKVLRRITKSAQYEAQGQTPWEFQSQHMVDGETWIPVEPAVMPVLPPNNRSKVDEMDSGPPFSPDDFPEHMQHFYVHHCMDSFSTMGQLTGEHFNFKNRFLKGQVRMGRMNHFVRRLKYKKCELGHASEHVHRYHHLLRDVVSDIPSTLLGELLHEELTLQKELEEFQPTTTGGALGYIPLEEFEDQKEACLVYPGEEALSSLNFHRVVLEYSKDKSPSMHMASKPLVYNLNGTVRQVSVARVDHEVNIGVRSDHFCGLWIMRDGQRPRPIQVVQLKEHCTSLNVSPHLPGELVIASESGAAYLWTVGKRPQKFRKETSNLYFNAKSPWRWCEFSAHPRVMLYADRTGVELTDSRSRDCSYTLFRIGKTANCRSGERVFLAKYLGQGHAYHHLITTQFSAYLLDERMPSVPALKWAHMMDSPPCFAQVLPAQGSSSTSKILLGAQGSQETVLLQYSGGCEQPCQSSGPIQKLYSPCERPTNQQLPHTQHKVERRLAAPAAGLAGTQNDCFLSVFQLTEAGDVFCQMLKLHTDTQPEPSRNTEPAEPLSNINSPQVSLGEEEPAEEAQEEGEVQETSGKEPFSDSDSERGRRRRTLSHLEVVVNDDEGFQASDTEEVSREPSSLPESSVPTVPVTRARPVRPAAPENESEELKLVWEKWLASLLTEATESTPRLQHQQIRTSDVIQFELHHRDKLEKDTLESLRKDLTDVMKNKKLLVHGCTYLPPLDATPFPEAVDTSDWPDDLSQRLSAAWGDGWRSWWDEKLGLNRDTKIDALRRKRRQEKRARARNRVPLSGSFTSSTSYQDNLSGWSSGTSQYLGSDAESFVNSQSAAEDERFSDFEAPSRSPAARREPTSQLSSPDSFHPLRSAGKPNGLEQDQGMPVSQSRNQASVAETDSSSKTVMKPSLPSQQRPWQQQDYLSSLFSSQEPSQDPGQVGEGTSLDCSSLAASQPLGLSNVLQRSSQRRTSSQISRPQRKKSRMGF